MGTTSNELIQYILIPLLKVDGVSYTVVQMKVVRNIKSYLFLKLRGPPSFEGRSVYITWALVNKSQEEALKQIGTEKSGVYRGGGLIGLGALFYALKIGNGLEARLGVMLYLCSKVACFPYTFKELSRGEGISMYV